MDLADLKSAVARVQGGPQAKAKVETLVLRKVRFLEVQVPQLNLLYYSIRRIYLFFENRSYQKKISPVLQCRIRQLFGDGASEIAAA